MNLTVFFEIIVCLLAVYGIYAILCRFLAHGCYKGDLAVGLRIKQEKETADQVAITDGVRRARFLTEGQCGRMLPPVILLTGEPSASLQEALDELGGECEIYCKIK